MMKTYKKGFAVETHSQDVSEQQLLNEKADLDKRLIEINADLKELKKLE